MQAMGCGQGPNPNPRTVGCGNQKFRERYEEELQAICRRVPQAHFVREGRRSGRDQGDQSHMGRSDASVREVRINYDALPSQLDFHLCGARFKGFSGPVGSGKSMALAQEAIRLCYMNPGRTGLLGAPTYPMLREATMATLFEILDGNRIRYEHNKAENTLVLPDAGSRIVFRPVDDYERLRGT